MRVCGAKRNFAHVSPPTSNLRLHIYNRFLGACYCKKGGKIFFNNKN